MASGDVTAGRLRRPGQPVTAAQQAASKVPQITVFFWIIKILTTAQGDMTATTLHLGFLASGVMFTVIFFIPGVLHWRFGLNSIVAFWWAYVVTRPLGASYADWLGVPKSVGGLGFGRGPVAIVLTIPIVALVTYLAVTRRDVEQPAAAPPAATPPRGRHRA